MKSRLEKSRSAWLEQARISTGREDPTLYWCAGEAADKEKACSEKAFWGTFD